MFDDIPVILFVLTVMMIVTAMWNAIQGAGRASRMEENVHPH